MPDRGCVLWKAGLPCLGVPGFGAALQAGGAALGSGAPGSVPSAPELTVTVLGKV